MVSYRPNSPFSPFLPISFLLRGWVRGKGKERANVGHKEDGDGKGARKRRITTEKAAGGKYMSGGYYGLSAPPDRLPLLYWFLALSTFLPYRQGIAPSIGANLVGPLSGP